MSSPRKAYRWTCAISAQVYVHILYLIWLFHPSRDVNAFLSRFTNKKRICSSSGSISGSTSFAPFSVLPQLTVYPPYLESH